MSRCLIATAPVSSQFTRDLLPSSVLQQAAAMSTQRRQQFLAGRSLLAAVMREFFGCAQLPDIQLSANGKPMFSGASLPFFSLSHSRQHVLVALCSAGEIGCDIETLRPRASMLTLAHEIFSAAENDWLQAQGENRQAAFWQLWTLREAWLKQQGSSVWQMAEIGIDPLTQRFSGPSNSGQIVSLNRGDSALALALPPSISQIDGLDYDASTGFSAYQAQWQRFIPAD